MAAISQETVNYFSAYQDYFWRWAEQGNVLEFANERTICYREDLSNILNGLPQTTSLSLGTVLLILCACKDDWEKLYHAEAVLMEIKPVSVEGKKDESDHCLQMKIQGLAFLNLVNKLPLAYRSAANRTALLQCIFDSLAIKGYHMGLLPVLKEFNSGTFDEQIFGTMRPLLQTTLLQDFAPLAAALAAFRDVESLEMKLRTGLTAIPKPIELPKPVPLDESLLDQLENDESTHSIASLVRRIMAALYIPMHLDGRDEQSLGGISDIATKGTYDKLLLSELAYDDLLLSARLANNEALFLQRESVPKNRTRELGLMVDSTLKMWGSARVYAVAASIAFRESKQVHQQMKVWSLGGRHLNTMALQTKNDVVELLEQMDTSLHCGEMLLKIMQEHTEKNGQYILITSPHFLTDPASMPYLLKVRERLAFLITISLGGHLQMIQFQKNSSKLIHEAKIDLDGLLMGRKTAKIAIAQQGLPAVFYEEKFPMYFPTSKIRHKRSHLYRLKNKAVVTISIDRRLLYWPSERYGALELIAELPSGEYCFGEIDSSLYLMLISETDHIIKLYNINPVTSVNFIVEVAVECKSAIDLNFTSPYFHFKNLDKLVAIDARSGEVIAEEKVPVELPNGAYPLVGGLSQLKKHLNNGYSTINSSKAIYLHTAGRLFSDRKEFIIVNGEFRWQENELAAVQWNKPSSQEVFVIDHLPNIKFTKYLWHNGSMAIMDSRGLLHLKSSDSTLPEVCIVMIIDQPTACWSMDGYLSGSKYFTGEANSNYIGTEQFYQKYIQSFIDRIK